MLNKLLIIFISFHFFTTYAQDSSDVKLHDSLALYTYSTISEFCEQMDDIFNDPTFSNANWGVVIQSLETGEYFYKRNEDKFFVPASNMKLFTTAAGLLLLGEDYKYSTNIFTDGKLDGSILEGNLIIQGRGDPTISGRFHDDNVYAVFSEWADSLLSLGIDEIKGNIIGDDNLFDDLGLGKGWSWDYESYWYAAQSSAISLNDNCVDIILKYNSEKDTLELFTSPETNYVVIRNEVRLVSKDSVTDVSVNRERGSNVVTIYGTFSRKIDSLKTYVTVNNPTQFAMVVLHKVFQQKGITVRGYPLDIDDDGKTLDYSSLKYLFSYYSPDMTEIVKVINKGSHNFYAEQLLKTIGLEIEGFGSVQNGVDASKEIFKEIGLNPENIVMADGSGLSYQNMVTPRQIVTLLKYFFNSKLFTTFYNSLPIAGVDGTLGNRMKNTRAQKLVRAKTGYIRAVRSLSGYTKTGDNEPIVFSMICNDFNVPVKLAENIQDLVCLRLINFKRKLIGD
ncbi:MAG: D-alanyl-D-alanine carboxypeptidase/D-alanyl-D-alanine-endopeptidase [Ignavibacteriaceae bacterium]|nr:D-alanyl-D-alanine carboxypeptidase/D-alanyl-D-alanine-endopeptidase [Ignavibacteriaceae bacterium]